MNLSSLKLILLILFVVTASCENEDEFIKNNNKKNINGETIDNGEVVIDLNELGINNTNYDKIRVDYTTYGYNGTITGYNLKSNLFETNIEVNNNHSVIIVHDLRNETYHKFERYRSDNGNYQLIPIEGIYSDSYSDSYPENYVTNGDDCHLSMMLCSTTSTLSTIGIAASDGPLPFMDAVAAAFYVSCNAGCGVDYQNCIDG